MKIIYSSRLADVHVNSAPDDVSDGVDDPCQNLVSVFIVGLPLVVAHHVQKTRDDVLLSPLGIFIPKKKVASQ